VSALTTGSETGVVKKTEFQSPVQTAGARHGSVAVDSKGKASTKRESGKAFEKWQTG
jgi:hypothetical protein